MSVRLLAELYSISFDNSDEECIPLFQRIKDKMNPKTDASSAAKKSKSSTTQQPCQKSSAVGNQNCSLCSKPLPPTSTLSCLSPKCKASFHITCLSHHFLNVNAANFTLLPVEGTCPKCNLNMLWGDLIRESQGFHQYLK